MRWEIDYWPSKIPGCVNVRLLGLDQHGEVVPEVSDIFDTLDQAVRYANRRGLFVAVVNVYEEAK